MNITNVPLDFENGKKFITSQPWCEFLSTASSVFIVGGSGNKLLFLAPLRFGRMLGTSLIFSLGVVELVTLHSGLKRDKINIFLQIFSSLHKWPLRAIALFEGKQCHLHFKFHYFREKLLKFHYF